MNKTYAFTDLHGMYNLWEQIRDYCDETDTLIFLGDACDRGEDGIKIMKELLKDPRVIYLKGNHEDIFVTVASELLEKDFKNFFWWISNGGQNTINQFLALDNKSQKWLLNELNNLQKTMTYINTAGKEIFLSHAGCRPGLTEEEMVLLGHSKDPYIWDRKHIEYSWPEEEKYQNLYIVHGHTPTQTLRDSFSVNIIAIEKYADEHKIDLDVASFASYSIALFDLDTLSVERYFYDTKTFKNTCL